MTGSTFPGDDLRAWLEEMAVRPLPGGVAAAAVAAAMGAGLVAKAGRVTVRRQPHDERARAPIVKAIEQADAVRQDLERLAAADVSAYRAVLREQRRQPSSGAAAEQREGEPAAWRIATEIPIEVAERCLALLQQLLAWAGSSWPGVRADLEIGRWLLETGVQAGLLATETNLAAREQESAGDLIRARLESIRNEYAELHREGTK